MRIVCCVAAIAAMLLPPVSSADSCDTGGCESRWGTSCASMKLSVCPAGDFEDISNGCGGGGDYIWVEVWSDCGFPLPNIPPTDFWFGSCDPSERLFLCSPPIVADSATNESGRTTFSLSKPSLGGCVLSGLWMAVQGVVIYAQPTCDRPSCLDILIKSPDLNGDGTVNLSDLAVFGNSYNKYPGHPAFNPCCDYNDDNQCNLSDFAHFYSHYSHRCM